MVAGGQGSKEQRSFLSDSKDITANAEKRQVRGVCFALSGLESLGSDDLSASASAVAGPTDASH